jgi:hypothetical protein
MMARLVWSVVSFPNNEWPDSYSGMATCTTLNAGLFIWVLFIFTALVLNVDLISAFMDAHVVLAYDLHRAFTRGMDVTYTTPSISL